jgi:hypothetical protein
MTHNIPMSAIKHLKTQWGKSGEGNSWIIHGPDLAYPFFSLAVVPVAC